MVSAAESNRRKPSSNPGSAGFHPFYFHYCGVITADVMNLWFKISDGIGERPNWAMPSDILLLIIAPAEES